jgi:hypothetical protein
MVKISKEINDYLKAQCTLFTRAKLLIDGYKILIGEIRIKNKIIIEVYVNGWIKGEWMSDKCEEGRKFHHHSLKQLHSAKFMRECHKGLNKKQIKDFGIKQVYYPLITPYFPSIKAFIKQIESTCDKVEIMKEEEA